MILTNEPRRSSKYFAKFEKMTAENNCLLIEKSKGTYAFCLLKKYAKGVGKIVYSRKDYPDGYARLWWLRDGGSNDN